MRSNPAKSSSYPQILSRKSCLPCRPVKVIRPCDERHRALAADAVTLGRTRIHGEARENSDGDSMSHKIGRFTGMANVPISQTDHGRRVRELLKNPGGLLTAKVLTGNVKAETGEIKAQVDSAQPSSLFPEDPYADESGTVDNLFDSDGK
jgi:hypothetical protein